jgi:hypothetical protein
MTAATVEVTELAGIDLDGAPPCETIYQWRWSRRVRKCGRPSTHRVRSACPVHGERVRFLCLRHFRLLKLGVFRCLLCDRKTPFLGEA